MSQLTNPILLKIEQFYPIDIEAVKKRWQEVMDVVNVQWHVQDIDGLLEHVNNTAHSPVMRKFYLNLVPASVISVMIQLKKEKRDGL